MLDVGCGTGLLTLPLAAHARAIIGMDPEPDMLSRARQAAAQQAVANVVWILGADTDLERWRQVLGDHALAAVTIADAIHWLDESELFTALRPALRPGGAIAIVTNGTALWRQDSEWSRALRASLEQWFGAALDAGAVTGADTETGRRQRHITSLREAGFAEIDEVVECYAHDIDFDRLVGTLYSAMSAKTMPTGRERRGFARHLRRALAPETSLTEQVRVTALVGRSR